MWSWNFTPALNHGSYIRWTLRTRSARITIFMQIIFDLRLLSLWTNVRLRIQRCTCAPISELPSNISTKALNTVDQCGHLASELRIRLQINWTPVENDRIRIQKDRVQVGRIQVENDWIQVENDWIRVNIERILVGIDRILVEIDRILVEIDRILVEIDHIRVQIDWI